MSSDENDPLKMNQPSTKRSLRIVFVLILVIMTIQGWFGDTVNIFVAPATGATPPPFSFGGFFQEVDSSSFLRSITLSKGYC